MIEVALKGLRGPQGPRAAHRVRGGHRRLDGERHLRAHRHDAEVVRRHLRASYENTDVVVSGKEIVRSPTRQRATIPARCWPRSGRCPRSRPPAGSDPRTTDARRDHRPRRQVARRRELGVRRRRRAAALQPAQAQVGRVAAGRRTRSRSTPAPPKKQDYAVGDTISVSANGPSSTLPDHRHREATATSTRSAARASRSATSTTAQEVLHQRGPLRRHLDRGRRRARPRRSSCAPSSRSSRDAPGQGLRRRRPRTTPRRPTRPRVRSAYFLLGFGGIALFVGAFVIFNTLSITVAQRTREFATLRTLGASRKQVMRSVVLEGVIVGLLASVVGLVLGIGIAKGMNALFAAFGVDLPDAGTVVASRTIIVSLLVGTVVTLLASVVPARRATRVPPIAAVREGATLPQSGVAQHSVKAGLGVIVARGRRDRGRRVRRAPAPWSRCCSAVACSRCSSAMALLAPRLVKPLARVVGWPGAPGGSPGELAERQRGPQPGAHGLDRRCADDRPHARHASSRCSAPGCALGRATRSSEQVQRRLRRSRPEGVPFHAAEGDTLAACPASRPPRTSATIRRSSRQGGARHRRRPGHDRRFYQFDWTNGSAARSPQLGDDGALVTKHYADKHHLTVGSRVAVRRRRARAHPGGARHLQRAGDRRPARRRDDLAGRLRRGFAQPKNTSRSSTQADGAGARSAAAVRTSPTRSSTPRRRSQRTRRRRWPACWRCSTCCSRFSVIVSLFGMVNTLVLSVFERTREIGMLRAIGMTRRRRAG